MNDFRYKVFFPSEYLTLIVKGDTVALVSDGLPNEYIILTPLNPSNACPNFFEEFIKIVQELFPDDIVLQADSKKIRATYVLDVIPLNQEETIYRRIIANKNRHYFNVFF